MRDSADADRDIFLARKRARRCGLRTRLIQARSAMFFPLLNGDQSRLAAPQLVLPLAAFQTPITVLALVHAGAAVLLSVGAATALP